MSRRGSGIGQLSGVGGQWERGVKKKMRQEEGVVESALVIIPLMALFLVTLEIIIAVNFRNVDLTLTQSDASARAISSILENGDEVREFKAQQSLESMRVLITHRKRTLPRLVPRYLLSGKEGDHSLDVIGMAVIEGSQ